jgi:predicted nuclease of restriction endonuclease-like RecB superfamily
LLPAELLRVRLQKGEVRPSFISKQEEYLKLAGNIISIFNSCIGKKKLYLNQAMKDLEESVFDYKLVRGLALLLERMCVFEIKAPFEPARARSTVFEIASKLGFTDKTSAISEAAKILGLSYEEVERSLFADLEEELILSAVQHISPKELVEQYNLSLTQTLLFRCIKMDFIISDNWKRVFSAIKRNGLMYSIQKSDDSYTISVDGPLSIFRMSERYGTSIAKILPEIMNSVEWKIYADILWRSSNRIFKLALSSSESDLFPKLNNYENYDSSVEERFAEEFSTYDTSWKIRREPEPLLTGSHVIIPDFSFERYGKKVYFEIVGFWTKEYLENKVKKLKMLDKVDIVLAVNKELACSKFEELPYDIIYYRNKVPVNAVVERLRKIQQDMESEEISKLENIDIDISGEVVELEEIAKKYHISPDALRKLMISRQLEGYTAVGDCLVSQKKLRMIASKLEGIKKLSDALSLIEGDGIRYPYELLRELGYKVKWAGLSIDESTIEYDS